MGKKKQKKGVTGKSRSGSNPDKSKEEKFLWNVPSPMPSRSSRRNTSYLDKLKTGEKKLNSMRDAQQLFKILARDYGNCIQLVLKFDESMQSVLSHATNILHPDLTEPLKLLSALGEEESLTQGIYKERMISCFESFFDAEAFMLKLTELLTSGRLDSSDHSTIAWFLLQLGKTGNEKFLNDPLMKDMIAFLRTSTGQGFPVLYEQLIVIFQMSDKKDEESSQKYRLEKVPVSLEAARQIMRPPGTREHDNDKANFRAISIVPTSSELRCKESPFLPSAFNPEHIDNKEAAALDRQFRLMRQDLIGVVKEELRAELKLHSGQRRRILPDPTLVDFGMKPEPHIVVRMSLPMRLSKRIQAMNNEDAKDFFETGPGNRVLKRGTLVLLVRDSADKSIDISAVGTVVARRDSLKIVKILGSDKRKRVLEVGISFNEESMRKITPLLQNLESKTEGVPMSGCIFNASAGLFSLQPICKALKNMDSYPMNAQLIDYARPPPPLLPHGGKDFEDLSDSIKSAIGNDISQKKALQEIFNSNVVLCQGPPGTGKTYIGVQMVKTMLEMENKTHDAKPLQILCLCYTNHALDSFLLDLMKAGIPKEFFVRLGSSPKIDPAIKSRCLGEIDGNVKQTFDQVERAAYGSIKREAEELEGRFKDLLNSIVNNSKWGKSFQWWKRICDWLEDHYFEEYVQLEVPQNEDNENYEIVSDKGEKIKSNYLWERWAQGKGRGIFQDTDMPTGIWKLKKNERQQLMKEWNSEWMQPQIDLLASTMKQLQKNAEALRSLRQTNELNAISSAKIIGCTTVAAAKFQNMINPSVVLIEEAGEILESHVIANLGNSCEQLIMIGDHLQLRPKIDNYELQVESRNGHDLNMSLFERLVIQEGSEIPIVPLTVQHRMRPDISDIIRGLGLYEKLIDHENTKGRDNVIGISKNVIFFNHHHSEQVDEATVALGMDTKVNHFEVEMVVKIAKYIVQQGQFSQKDITILTPYLGQLSLIRKYLDRSCIGSFVNDKDFNDLSKMDLNEGSASSGTNRIRIATVDNYQGEENGIVIVSLVRSGNEGIIGFLASEQRINVMLSRARQGMYVVGNLDGLTRCKSSKGRKLWTGIKEQLEKSDQLLNYFPATCSRHKCVHIIRCSDDFDKLAPEGGCQLRCSHTLECGHQCYLQCHPCESHVHSTIKCMEKVEDVCSNGHLQTRACWSTVNCSKIMHWRCPKNHILKGLCKKGRPNSCNICEELERIERESSVIEEEYDEEIFQKQKELIDTKGKLDLKLKKDDHTSRLQMMEKEQLLMQMELNNQKLEVNEDSEETEGKIVRVKEPSACANNTDGECTLLKDEGENLDTPVISSKKKFAPETVTVPRKMLKLTKVMDFVPVNSSPNGTGEYHPFENENNQVEVGSIKSTDISRRKESPYDLKQVPRKKLKQEGEVNTENEVTGGLLSDYTFQDAMKRFEEEKYLEVDDLLEICLLNHQETKIKDTLEAVRYLVHNEIDPSICTWAGYENYDRNEIQKPETFEDAIQCWATFESFSSLAEYPRLAIDIANKYVSHVNDGGLHFLKTGRDRALTVIESMKKATSSYSNGKKKSDKVKDIEREWTSICVRDASAPRVVSEEIMTMTGLADIKQKFVDQYGLIRVAQRQNDAGSSSYNSKFLGNAGTGKTTIAKLYGKFLKELEILPDTAILFNVTAASLMNKGVSELEKMLDSSKEAGGAVIFIDEAYQLSLDKRGECILDYILPVSEALNGPYGKLVWILAGYSKEMEKLFEHNQGLPSRFPQTFQFDDYDALEMQSIFEGFMYYKEKEPDSNSNNNKEKSSTYSTIRVPRTVSRSQRRRTALDSSDGEVFVDRFGNRWECNRDRCLWVDEHNNTTGYHPEDIGFSGNPLASMDGHLWEHDGNNWIATSGKRQRHYPGTSTHLSTTKVKRTPPFKCEDDKYLRIAMRRLERQSGRPGFGNARSVRILFDTVRERQARRLTKESKKGKRSDDFLFTKSDLLGPSLDTSKIKNSNAYKELQAMEGLLPVKEQIDLLIKLGSTNLQREEREEPLLDIMLNRVFLGNPGTGKTSIAKIYGQLLVEMGLLSKGEVIVKNPSDFKGSVLGSSEKNTRDILRAAEGNVLVIDEAYGLCNNKDLNGVTDLYGTAVIDTLVEQVQARPGDDRAVIMLGYQEEMEEMFKNCNPGLSRRFQLDQAYIFPDYDDTALLKILIKKAKESQLKISVPVAKLAVRSLARARSKPHFGNAGAVDILLSKAKERLQRREGVPNELKIEDFDLNFDDTDKDQIDELLSHMIGMNDIKQKLEKLKKIVSFDRSRGDDPSKSVSYNYLFLGNPGTGKTSVARLMGKMFKTLGLLPDDQVVECTPKDFVTGFVGQAGKKTEEILKRSKGGVLFIDEAYQLNPKRGGSFMTEVVDELCAKLTDEAYKGKVLVLLAGYEADMDDMLAVNPGLKSRFVERMKFNDLDKESTRDLVNLKLRNKRIPLYEEDSQSQTLLHHCERLVSSKDFSNGRDVDTVVDFAKSNLADRASGPHAKLALDDVCLAIEELLDSRKPSTNSKSCTSFDHTFQESASSEMNPIQYSTDIGHDIASNEDISGVDDNLEGTTAPVDNETNNLFNGFDLDQLKKLQDVLDSLGLNNEEGIKHLLVSNGSDEDIIQKVASGLTISNDIARKLLIGWKKKQKQLQQEKTKNKREGMEAIWHCAVCGRGGLPAPVCYFAPYISGYRRVSS